MDRRRNPGGLFEVKRQDGLWFLIDEQKMPDGGIVSIATNLDPSSPVIRGDERAIQQIILNLLSNATRFTDEGGVITVSSELDSDGGVLLKVTDSGIGIAPTDIPKVLEPFGQIGDALSRGHGGTGLGLPIAKRLTEMHDAVFELESGPGVVTAVTLRFPPKRRFGAVDTGHLVQQAKRVTDIFINQRHGAQPCRSDIHNS